jgi:hypothetical protein
MRLRNKKPMSPSPKSKPPPNIVSLIDKHNTATSVLVTEVIHSYYIRSHPLSINHFLLISTTAEVTKEN